VGKKVSPFLPPLPESTLSHETRLLETALAKLEVALPAEAEFLRGVQRSQPFALAFDEHREFAGDFVVRGDGQGSSRADERVRLVVPLQERVSY